MIQKNRMWSEDKTQRKQGKDGAGSQGISVRTQL